MGQRGLPVNYSRRGVLRTMVAGVSVLSVSALLEACGASAGSGTAGDKGGSAAAGQDSGKPIDLLRVALPGSLSNLYPGQESGILNYYAAAVCLEGLVGVDAQGRIVPALASAVVRKDPKTYVYTLRQNATFHDGSPVTVDDVLYSIQMARDSKVSPSTASYWANLATAAKTGSSEITLTSKTADEAFGWVPGNADALWIAPKAAWEKVNGKIGTASALLVGSGPYKVTSFAPDSHVEFTRNDAWWGTKPKVARIRIDFIADDNTRLLAWQAGKADLALNVPLAASDQWKRSAHSRIVFTPDRSYAGLTFNTSVKPFDDPHVRKAIAYAVNRQAIVRDVLHGHGQVATALSTPEQFGGLWTAEEATRQLAVVPQYDYDLAKAKAELAQSRVPGGFTANITYPSTGPQLGTAALALAADLKKLGITLNVKELAIEQWLAELNKGPALSFMWYFNTTGDPGELATWLLSAGNPAKYTSAKVSGLVAQAAGVTDPARRAMLLIQAQAAQAADVAYAPLWWGQSAVALRDTIGLSGYNSYTMVGNWPGNVYAAT